MPECGSLTDRLMRSVVVFGGGSGGAQLDDTWAWTGSDWQQLQPVFSPSPRESFGLVYDPGLGHVVCFGGADAFNLFDDTWWLAWRP